MLLSTEAPTIFGRYQRIRRPRTRLL